MKKLLIIPLLVAAINVFGQEKTKVRLLTIDTTKMIQKPGKIAAIVNQDGTLAVFDSLATINYLWDYFKKQSHFSPVINKSN